MGSPSSSTGGGNTGPANRYTTPKPKKKAKGLIPGFIEALKTGRESDARKRKEYAENEKLKGTPDYQGDLKLPPTITDVLNEQKAQKERDGENNSIKEVTKTAPTVAEVDQATTDTTPTDTTPTETAETTEKNKLLKIKKRGRSKSILSGSQGVTKMAADYSLGKKSLLGRV